MRHQGIGGPGVADAEHPHDDEYERVVVRGRRTQVGVGCALKRRKAAGQRRGLEAVAAAQSGVGRLSSKKVEKIAAARRPVLSANPHVKPNVAWFLWRLP